MDKKEEGIAIPTPINEVRKVQEIVRKKLLTAAQIFSVEDLKCIDVEVPEWGGTVRLRTLTGEEAAIFIDADTKTSNARSLVMSAVNEDGEQLFTEDDIPRLRKKSMKAFMRVQGEVLKLNGINTDLETVVKNV